MVIEKLLLLEKMKTKKSIIIILSIALLFVGNLQPTSAQNLDALSDYSIKLVISPSHIEEGITDHHIGYIYVLSKNDVPITSSQDVSIKLISEHPEIASVPKNIIITSNEIPIRPPTPILCAIGSNANTQYVLIIFVEH